MQTEGGRHRLGRMRPAKLVLPGKDDADVHVNSWGLVSQVSICSDTSTHTTVPLVDALDQMKEASVQESTTHFAVIACPVAQEPLLGLELCRRQTRHGGTYLTCMS